MDKRNTKAGLPENAEDLELVSREIGTTAADLSGWRDSFLEAGAAPLKIRHDHGSQYRSRDFQKEVKFIGAERYPAFVPAPEDNGCAKRFIRSLKESLRWVRWLDTIEALRQALLEFQRTYAEQWLIERHGHRPSAAIRRDQSLNMQIAA